MSHSTPILARHLFVVLMSAAVTTSCSHLFAHAYTLRGCEWLEIDEPDAQVTAQRVTIGEEAACTAAKAPGEYRIRRVAYTVEIWNGERWFPQLHLRIKEPAGEHMQLRLRSELSLEMPGGSGAMSQAARHQRGLFDYRWAPQNLGEAPPLTRQLTFDVVAPDGQLVGTESLKIVRKAGGQFRAY